MAKFHCLSSGKRSHLFLNATITKFNLSNREYNNIKSIVIALLRIAIDEEIIVENPMNGIYIKAKFRAVRKKSDGSKLYLNDEYEALVAHLEEENTIEGTRELNYYE